MFFKGFFFRVVKSWGSVAEGANGSTRHYRTKGIPDVFTYVLGNDTYMIHKGGGELNSLTNVNIWDWTKSKAFADER